MALQRVTLRAPDGVTAALSRPPLPSPVQLRPLAEWPRSASRRSPSAPTWPSRGPRRARYLSRLSRAATKTPVLTQTEGSKQLRTRGGAGPVSEDSRARPRSQRRARLGAEHPPPETGAGSLSADEGPSRVPVSVRLPWRHSLSAALRAGAAVVLVAVGDLEREGGVAESGIVEGRASSRRGEREARGPCSGAPRRPRERAAAAVHRHRTNIWRLVVDQHRRGPPRRHDGTRKRRGQRCRSRRRVQPVASVGRGRANSGAARGSVAGAACGRGGRAGGRRPLGWTPWRGSWRRRGSVEAGGRCTT